MSALSFALGLAFIWMGVGILRKGRLTVHFEDERSLALGLLGLPPVAGQTTGELRGNELKLRAYTFIGFGVLCILVAVFLVAGDWLLHLLH
jgi:hypothetical protein